MNPETSKNAPESKPGPEGETSHSGAPSRPETIKEHEGATEDQVGQTTPPAGPAYDDEPKQG